MEVHYINDKKREHIWYLFKFYKPNIYIRLATYNKKTNKLTIDVDQYENNGNLYIIKEFIKEVKNK